MNKLVFGRGNAKLGRDVYTFSLPAGYTCPGANECLSRANRTTGKITDGPNVQFRCFSASQEALFPAVRNARWQNLTELRSAGTKSKMRDLILANLPKKANVVRLHVSGDFFSEAYFLAWCGVATIKSEVLFYGYTKSLLIWQKHKDAIPDNLVLTASKGGKYDGLIASASLRSAEVVFSEEEARTKSLTLDHDDSLAMSRTAPSFALLLHGPQPAKSPASKALSALKAEGEYGYGRKATSRKLSLNVVYLS